MNEIERKFLLKAPMRPSDFADLLVRQSIMDKSNLILEKYDQFYIADGKNTVRVRIRSEESIGISQEGQIKKAQMTIKGLPIDDEGLSRKEIEFDIELEKANELKSISLYGLEKQRMKYRCPETEQTIEFDFYLNELNYLVTAEIEYPDIETAKKSKLPDIVSNWFTEVTGQREYSNDYLAKEKEILGKKHVSKNNSIKI